MSIPFDIIDLTHPLSPDIASWNGGCGFAHSIKLDYADCKTPVKFRVQQIKMHAGIGTHMDAPSHCIAGGASIADLKVTDLIVPCIKISVADKAHAEYKITAADVHAWEAQWGQIVAGTFVVFHTGWDQYWHTPEQYRNQHIFPCIAEDAAELLLVRNIAGLGIDTLSPDRPDLGFIVHEKILGAGKYIVENIANASTLPEIGNYIFALPLPIVEGTEAPMRLLAIRLKTI